MSRFNTKKVLKSKTTNIAGGSAYKLGSEQELIHAVLTTFLDDKYYESGVDRISRIQKLVSQNKPEFVANLAVIARTEFNLRSVSHLLIAELSKQHKGDDLIKRAVVASAIRPDDLTEIVSCVGLPIPKQIKRGARNALLKFDRYQLAKYKGEGNSLSLVDLFNLVHPKVQHANKEQKKAWKDLIKGDLKSFDTWETELSNAKNDTARTKILNKLITENKLGYMALIRNINNFIKYNISATAKKAVINKLTSKTEVYKSRQLPFRFVTAFNNVKGNVSYSDAISEAMDIAVDNVPTLEGKTLIAIDSSSSMMGSGFGRDEESGAIYKASIFGATLLKANKDADVILYDERVKTLAISSRPPVIDLANSIVKEANGGGTNTSLVFHFAEQSKTKYSRIIIISDNESWQTNAQTAYNAYKTKTGNNPFVYAIDIQGYGTTDVKGGKVFNLSGWSDRLLDFIGQAEKGETLIDYIKNYTI